MYSIINFLFQIENLSKQKLLEDIMTMSELV